MYRWLAGSGRAIKDVAMMQFRFGNEPWRLRAHGYIYVRSFVRSFVIAVRSLTRSLASPKMSR